MLTEFSARKLLPPDLISEGPRQAQRVKPPLLGLVGKGKGNKGSEDNVQRTEWTIYLTGPRLIRLTLPLVWLQQLRNMMFREAVLLQRSWLPGMV